MSDGKIEEDERMDERTGPNSVFHPHLMFVGNFKIVETEIPAISLHDRRAFILVDAVGKDLFASAGPRETQSTHDAPDVKGRLDPLDRFGDDVVQRLHVSGVEAVGEAAHDGDADRPEVGLVVDVSDGGATTTTDSSIRLVDDVEGASDEREEEEMEEEAVIHGVEDERRCLMMSTTKGGDS